MCILFRIIHSFFFCKSSQTYIFILTQKVYLLAHLLFYFGSENMFENVVLCNPADDQGS